MIRVKLENLSRHAYIVRQLMDFLHKKVANCCVSSFLCSAMSIIGKLMVARDFFNTDVQLFVTVDLEDGENVVVCFEGAVGTVLTGEYTKYLGMGIEKYLRESRCDCPVCRQVMDMCKHVDDEKKDVLPEPFMFSPDTVYINAKCITCDYFLHKLIIEYLRFLCMKNGVECDKIYCVLSNLVENQEKRCKILGELESVDRFVEKAYYAILMGKEIHECNLEPIVKEILSNGLVCDKHRDMLSRLSEEFARRQSKGTPRREKR